MKDLSLPNPAFSVDASGIFHTKLANNRSRHRMPTPGEIDVCRQFLAQCNKIKGKGFHSYRLKHIIEHCMGQYVPNGACIQAALDLGIPVVPERDQFPLNAYIGISRLSVRKMLKQSLTGQEVLA